MSARINYTDHSSGGSRIQRRVRESYVLWIRPLISTYLNRQRLKIVWDVWGYFPLLGITTLSLLDRLRLVLRFLKVDWHVAHAHRPSEISMICRALAIRPARHGEAFVEAGCWQGGSSAKFSIICQKLGYGLVIYDSFEGVQEMKPEEKVASYDFSGEYAAHESTVRRNLALFGEPEGSQIYKGWFSETLAGAPLPYSVRLAYVDCDLAKGTNEALVGIVPALVDDGVIFSQDFHIPAVRCLLLDPATWRSYGKGSPQIERLGKCLASISFRSAVLTHSEFVASTLRT